MCSNASNQITKSALAQRAYRARLKADAGRYQNALEKDRLRKKKENASQSEKRKKSRRLTLIYREKERKRKALQRLKQKDSKTSRKEAAIKVRRATIGQKNQEISELRNELYECYKEVDKLRKSQIYDEDSANQPFTHSTPKPGVKILLDQMTPKTKRRLRDSLSESSLEYSARQRFREIGLNLSKSQQASKSGPSSTGTSTELEDSIVNFFHTDGVTKVCPDKKKVVEIDGDIVPLRYRLDNLKILHQKYLASQPLNCSLSTFQRHVPKNVRRPKAYDWGTCLCATCLNPTLKYEKLAQENIIQDVGSLETLLASDGLDAIDDELRGVTSDANIKFACWKKVPNPDAKYKGKISRKVIENLPCRIVANQLRSELSMMESHLNRAHAQYHAFKMERENAMKDPSSIVLQIDFAENMRLRQSREEKSAYYCEEQISIHAVHTWTSEGEESLVAISDSTDHRAPAVWAGIMPILENAVTQKMKTYVCIVSDSPTSQYRNKEVFFMMKKVCDNWGISMRWIYLEAGHGKGISDGIGATIKSLIQQLLDYSEGDAIYRCSDLLKHGLRNRTTVKILHYDKFDISRMREVIPLNLIAVNKTMMLHDVKAQFNMNYLLVRNVSDEEYRREAVPEPSKLVGSHVSVQQSLDMSSDTIPYEESSFVDRSSRILLSSLLKII